MWVPGSVWKGAENLAPTGIRSLDLPACSESLYRLSYHGPYNPRRTLLILSSSLFVSILWVNPLKPKRWSETGGSPRGGVVGRRKQRDPRRHAEKNYRQFSFAGSSLSSCWQLLFVENANFLTVRKVMVKVNLYL